MAGTVDVAGLIPYKPVGGECSRVKRWQDAGFKVVLCNSCAGFGEIADCDIFAKDADYFDKACPACGGTGRMLAKQVDCTIKFDTKFREYERSTKSEVDTPG